MLWSILKLPPIEKSHFEVQKYFFILLASFCHVILAGSWCCSNISFFKPFPVAATFIFLVSLRDFLLTESIVSTFRKVS